MSVKVIAAVYRFSKEKLARRLILLALADAASDDGVTWIKPDTIATKTLLTRRYLARELLKMTDDGVVETRKAKSGGHRVTVYRVVLPGLSEVDYDRLPFTLDSSFSAHPLPPSDDVRISHIPELPPASDEVRNSHTVGSVAMCEIRTDDVRISHSTECELRTPRARGPFLEPLGEPSGTREVLGGGEGERAFEDLSGAGETRPLDALLEPLERRSGGRLTGPNRKLVETAYAGEPRGVTLVVRGALADARLKNPLGVLVAKVRSGEHVEAADLDRRAQAARTTSSELLEPATDEERDEGLRHLKALLDPGRRSSTEPQP